MFCFLFFSEDQAVFGTSGLTWWSCFKLVGPFTMVWAAVNYMYARALSLMQPADVTAIFTTNVAFVYVGSWGCLQERLVLLPAKVINPISVHNSACFHKTQFYESCWLYGNNPCGNTLSAVTLPGRVMTP